MTTSTILDDVAALLPDVRDAARVMVKVDAALSTKRTGTPAERALVRLMRKPLVGRRSQSSLTRWAKVHAAMLLALVEQCEAPIEEAASAVKKGTVSG